MEKIWKNIFNWYRYWYGSWSGYCYTCFRLYRCAWGVNFRIFIGGLLCYIAVDYIRGKLQIDDSLDVFAVHGVGGILGTLLVAFLATSTFSGLGLAEGQTGLSQFIVQLKAVALTVIWTSLFTYLILKLTSFVVSLRVDEQEEIEGLDLRSHGEKGYHSD